MKKLYVVLIVILSLAVSAFCLAVENGETKESEKSDNTLKNPKPKQGDKFTNSIGMEFVYIEPGKFKMGSAETAEELAKKYKEPANKLRGERQHDVILTKGFWMQNTEVTKSQFRKFVNATGYKTYFAGLFEKEKDDYPITGVFWNDAKAFCDWLTKQDKDGKLYRLPTEAEWEYACRAGSTTAYYWGDNMDNDYCWDFGTVILEWYQKKGEIGPRKVGTKKPNKWGLYDMSGNVCEWCSDWLGAYPKEEKTDPQGPKTSGAWNQKVKRGGSWGDGPAFCRSASRINGSGILLDIDGFRVVREQKGQ